MNLDPVVIVNLILCIVIFVLGYAGYQKSGDTNALLIGIAFGLFGISHAVTILGVTLLPEVTFIILRVAGYILVAGALYRYLKK